MYVCMYVHTVSYLLLVWCPTENQWHPFDWSIPNDHLEVHLLSDWVWVEVLVLISDYRPNIWCYYLSLALCWSCRY